MKYQITFHATKMVDDWDNEQGASGKTRMIDEWSHSMESNSKPTRTDFANFVYDRYSLATNKFLHWPDEPGRFTISRIENNDGEEDPSGKYLADYDVTVTCRRLSPDVPVGTFGLKAIDKWRLPEGFPFPHGRGPRHRREQIPSQCSEASHQGKQIMKYQITFHATKMVDDWDNEQGASGKTRMIDEWSHSMESNSKPTRTDFANFVYDRYSLATNKFLHWPDEPGRFTISRIENNDGEEDPSGKYLADYDVTVTCRRLSPDVPVGTFGLKAIDK